jgi:hypothetical protein
MTNEIRTRSDRIGSTVRSLMIDLLGMAPMLAPFYLERGGFEVGLNPHPRRSHPKGEEKGQ